MSRTLALALVLACAAGCKATKCPAERLDCDGQAATGCEVKRLDDERNCGACGTDCGERACVRGLCGPAPAKIAGWLKEAGGLAIDGDHLYWTTGPALWQIPKTGGTPRKLHEGSGALRSLVAHKGRLFWVEPDPERKGLLWGLAPGEEPRLLALLPSYISDLAVEDGVYVACLTALALKRHRGCTPHNPPGNPPRRGESRILRVPLGGGQALPLTGELSFPSSVSLDRDFIYWINTNTDGHASIERVHRAGGKVEVLFSGRSGVSQLFVQNGWLIWSEAGLLLRARTDGSDLSLLAPVSSFTAESVFAGSGEIFVGTTLGRVLRWSEADKAFAPLASSQAVPGVFAVDTGRVFWLNLGHEDTHFSDGALMSAALGELPRSHEATP